MGGLLRKSYRGHLRWIQAGMPRIRYEIAEFFQALKATIAKRQGYDGLLDSAFEELVHALLPAANLQAICRVAQQTR